jgi:hypothetical protein
MQRAKDIIRKAKSKLTSFWTKLSPAGTMKKLKKPNPRTVTEPEIDQCTYRKYDEFGLSADSLGFYRSDKDLLRGRKSDSLDSRRTLIGSIHDRKCKGNEEDYGDWI